MNPAVGRKQKRILWSNFLYYELKTVFSVKGKVQRDSVQRERHNIQFIDHRLRKLTGFKNSLAVIINL